MRYGHKRSIRTDTQPHTPRKNRHTAHKRPARRDTRPQTLRKNGHTATQTPRKKGHTAHKRPGRTDTQHTNAPEEGTQSTVVRSTVICYVTVPSLKGVNQNFSIKADMGVSKKSVSWTSRFVTTLLQDNERRSDVTFLVQTFWTPPYRQEDVTGLSRLPLVKTTTLILSTTMSAASATVQVPARQEDVTGLLSSSATGSRDKVNHERARSLSSLKGDPSAAPSSLL
jgi:hypothetical protein